MKGSFKHMAYCGFDCGNCPIFIACVNNDEALKAKLAVRYSTPEKKLTADDIRCYGCKADERYVHPYCSECVIRSCAADHGVSFNCGECPEYPCATITERIPEDRESRQNMDAVHNSQRS